MGSIREVTKEDFREAVSRGWVLVDVWGPACQPCLAMMPAVEALAADRGDSLSVVKLEAPKARRLCIELRLMGLPAFLLFHDGQEVGRLSGPEATFDALVEWLDRYLLPSAD
jgi:thioredoxin 1